MSIYRDLAYLSYCFAVFRTSVGVTEAFLWIKLAELINTSDYCRVIRQQNECRL